MALEKEEQPEEEWGREEEEEVEEEEEEEGKNSAGTFEGESLSEHTAGKASSLHARWRKQQATSGALADVSAVLGSWRLVVERLSVLFLRLLLSLQRLQRLLWWLLELHILKIVSSYMIWMSVKEVRVKVAAVGRPYACLTPPAPSFSRCVCSTCCLWCAWPWLCPAGPGAPWWPGCAPFGHARWPFVRCCTSWTSSSPTRATAPR